MCETSKEKARDDYTILFQLINEYNTGNFKTMNEYNSNNFKLITQYNTINFALIIGLNSLLFIYVNIVLGKTIAKQQRRIDDLKRELEEMKKC